MWFWLVSNNNNQTIARVVLFNQFIRLFLKSVRNPVVYRDSVPTMDTLSDKNARW